MRAARRITGPVLFCRESINSLTQASLEKLLAWLGADRECAGARYESLRQELLAFFARQSPKIPTEEYVDKTFDRIAVKLEKGDDLSAKKPELYCRAVARRLVLEFWRCGASKSEDFESSATSRQLDQQAIAAAFVARADERKHERMERQRACLKKCLQRLKPSERELLQRYYGGDEQTREQHRQKLAQAFGISYDNLRLRAYRVRQKLKDCLHNCMNSEAAD